MCKEGDPPLKHAGFVGVSIEIRPATKKQARYASAQLAALKERVGLDLPSETLPKSRGQRLLEKLRIRK